MSDGFWKLKPLPHTAVTFDDVFWAPRLKTNREATIPHVLKMIRESGRLDNFRKAAGKTQGEFRGLLFDDSDVYKWAEGAAYSLATHPDPKLEAELDEVIEAIAGAQQPDGYLNSYYTLREPPSNRWTHLRGMHELYCAGHLFEAAVAHFRATGKRNLLDVACRFADCIDAVFGPGKRRGAPGHEEIELALVKLYHATGEARYLGLAQFFIDIRGTEPNVFLAEITNPDEKFDVSVVQAHKPVRQQAEVAGHSVRAMYLYSGMADIYAETGDTSLLDALERLWANMTAKRMYVTGGLGSTARYEGFTSDYDLPNEAYAETCAAIGSVLWNHRMLGLTAQSRFADVLETALYNNVLSGVGLDGTSFFYENPLRRRDGKQRVPWYTCACCPSNLVRLLASLGSYVCSQSPSNLWLHLYAGCTIKATLNGAPVVLAVKTDYPWDGNVEIKMGLQSAAEFALHLRLPGWSTRRSIAVNGAPAEFAEQDGYACINRQWADGDAIALSFEMEPLRIEANPHIEADFGKVAIRRGPLVYCLEQADNPHDLFTITLPVNSELKHTFKKDVLGGVVLIEALAEVPDYSDWEGRLYRAATERGARPAKIAAVPYCCWANRGPGEMLVWINDSE